MHRGMADMMKAMGGAKRGPLAGLANAMGMGGGMPSPEQMPKLAKKMPAGQLPRRHAGLAADHAEICRRIYPACPACRVWAESFLDCRADCRPVSERRNDINDVNTFSRERKLKNVSRNPSGPRRHQEAAGLSHRRRRHRAPRDGRFIERLGYFNPLLPKDKTERLKLDLEKVQAWMKKGAQPSDRVTRFLDAAGVMKREKRNNPEKAIPRKERKAKAEEATKAKEAGDAAAKTAANAKAADKAAADKAAAEKPAEAPAAR